MDGAEVVLIRLLELAGISLVPGVVELAVDGADVVLNRLLALSEISLVPGVVNLAIGVAEVVAKDFGNDEAISSLVASVVVAAVPFVGDGVNNEGMSPEPTYTNFRCR